MYYAGLDLHKRYFTLCVLTSEGEVVADHRRLPAALEPLTTTLRGLGGPVTVTIEATLQWAWLHDRLAEAGIPVVVAHPQQVKLISQARCKTDPIDARKLAELTRAGLLPAIWVPTPAIRAWRQLSGGGRPWCAGGPGRRIAFMERSPPRISGSPRPICSGPQDEPGWPPRP